MQLDSERKGPVVWLTACGHGDEVGGMVIIQEIFKKLRKVGLTKGQLYAFPLMNPIGFEMASRQVTFSMEDLNRSFPGNPSGSLAERIADKIFTSIISTNPTLVIDLHNDWMKSIPYTLLDLKRIDQHENAYQSASNFGHLTGFIVIEDTDDLHHTLSRSLLHFGIPALTLEVGESFVVNEVNVEYGVKAIFNLLEALGMIDFQFEQFKHTTLSDFEGKELKFYSKPVTSSSGIIRYQVKPGEVVKRGKPIAKIYNAFGKLQETLTAEQEGIVLGHADSSVSYPGASILAFGIL